ncbi:MAG: UDP-N-acetylglucosamine 1-carboxyvinyltransferase [Candidatus Pacebacteria bacterium]|nr:UDP-N-acetylglucosamine 1-carboxyvinyltransferase [Candidatus Paceibacterota bacterium]
MSKTKSDQLKIGEFIKNLREERGLTQAELAKALGSAQSAIARMEKGEQNLTISQLAKVSELLGRQILSLSKSMDFEVTGGQKLSGSVRTNYSKNGAINMLCASLLNKGKTILHGIPKIEEVFRYIEIMESLGVSVRWIEKDTLEIIPPKKLLIEKMNLESAKRTRSFTFVGALIHWSNKFSFPHSGGCKMGERTIASHKYGLGKLGVSIKTLEDSYDISHKKLNPAEFVLYESSDTGAIGMIIATAGIDGKSIIRFAPPNYQVQDVCFLIEKMGVQIEGIGTTTLTVHGHSNINETVEHWNSEDPIESMFFISAGLVTRSTITITHCPIEFIELELEKLRQMGAKIKVSKSYLSKNGRTLLRDITVMPSNLTAPLEKLHAQPFPGMQNDNLPFFVPIATQAKGTTLIHDWTWENRAIYFTEINKLGANVRLVDPHRAFIDGPTKLRGAQIVCPPALRPSAVILIAMLAAEGTSLLRNVYSITRGYEEIAERLNKLGAKIRVVKGI